MRVALVSPYALSVYGGVQTQTLAMSRELVARGHEVLVVAPDVNDAARAVPVTGYVPASAGVSLQQPSMPTYSTED